MTTTVWHNPRCSKSRLTVALLEEHGIEPEIRLYLDNAPTAAELSSVLSKLGLSAWELLRRGEKIFKELDLNQHSTEDAIIAAMVEHPVLIERPVVIRGDAVALGRPPENVLTLLDYPRSQADPPHPSGGQTIDQQRPARPAKVLERD